MKFEKHYARCTDLAAQDRRIFFFPLGRLLESAEGQRNHASYDSAEFFSRRLRENERTLVTLTLRIDEAFPNEVEVISWQSFHTAPYFIMHTVLC